MTPSSRKRERNECLASSDVLTNQAAALLLERMRRSRKNSPLILAKLHAAECRVGQTLEADRGDRGARGSQSGVGEWHQAINGATSARRRR